MQKDVIDEKEAAARFAMGSVRSLRRMIEDGKFPKPFWRNRFYVAKIEETLRDVNGMRISASPQEYKSDDAFEDWLNGKAGKNQGHTQG